MSRRLQEREPSQPGRDRQAWEALVERYAPLIWSICCQYRLGHVDAQDVGLSVWLRPTGHDNRSILT